jgi:hypothetical protein
MGKGEKVLTVSFGSIENDYKIALGEEVQCNKKVTVTLSLKNPYFDRYLVFGLGLYSSAMQFW